MSQVSSANDLLKCLSECVLSNEPHASEFRPQAFTKLATWAHELPLKLFEVGDKEKGP